MGIALTSVTTAAVARILGRRIEQLTAAIKEAITALEADEDTRSTGQEIADRLREAL